VRWFCRSVGDVKPESLERIRPERALNERRFDMPLQQPGIKLIAANSGKIIDFSTLIGLIHHHFGAR
jgi:hypothetical protein